MSQSTFVLRALRVLGPEEILKLTQVVHQQVPLKKAVGEELIFWEDEPVKDTKKAGAKVLPFGKKEQSDRPLLDIALGSSPASEGENEKKEEESIQYSDIVLWQREIAKGAEASSHKIDAVKGYKKSTEMYVVKSLSEEGKEKIRFASTDGVLVNKKQA